MIAERFGTLPDAVLRMSPYWYERAKLYTVQMMRKQAEMTNGNIGS